MSINDLDNDFEVMGLNFIMTLQERICEWMISIRYQINIWYDDFLIHYYWNKNQGSMQNIFKNMPTLMFVIIYSKQLHGIQDKIQIVFPRNGKKSYSRGRVIWYWIDFLMVLHAVVEKIS